MRKTMMMALGAGVLAAALQAPDTVLAASRDHKPPIRSKQTCINNTLFTEGRAPTQHAARKTALQKWQASVTSAWGASFANYAKAKNQSTKYWNDRGTIHARVGGKPCN